MAKRVVPAIAALLFVLVAAAVGAGAWVLYTPAGLRWSLDALVTALHGALTVSDASGTWIDGVTVAGVRYESESLTAEASTVHAVLSPWSVLRLQPRVETLAAAQLALVLRPGTDTTNEPPRSLALPLPVDVASAHVGELTVERAGAQYALRDVDASYSGGPGGHHLRRFHAVHELATVDGNASVGARSPFPLEAAVHASVRQPLAATADVKLAGSLLDMKVSATANDAATQLRLDARVTPFAAMPLAEARATVAELDLHRYVDALPRTRIAADLAVKAQGERWTGPLRVTNALHGPWDRDRLPVAQIEAQVALTPKTAQLDGLRIDLGAAGTVNGTATVQQDRIDAKLATRALDLRGLQSALRTTRLQGEVVLAFTADRQSATGTLKEDDVTLAFDAARTGDDVRVSRFVARSRGSELTGDARLSLAGRRPYEARAMLRGFDPAAWGDFPRGTLNGRVSVAGALAADEIRAQYALDGSRLLGSPLDGAGRFTYARRRLSDADLRLSLAGNAIIAKGAFGAPADQLTLHIAAPRLEALGMGLGGAIAGSARLGGTWQAPRGSVDVRARRLARGDALKAETLAVKGELRSLEQRAFQVNAHAEGVTTPAWQGESIDLSAEGTAAAHTVNARAKGGELDLVFEARGALQGERWSGVVSRLENRGPVAFALGSPVDVTAGRDTVRLGAFAATLMDGHLEVAGLTYDRGEITSEGRFSRLPVRPLLAFAGQPADARDTLRLDGRWSIARDPRMTVAFELERNSGDLVIGADRPLALNLETLHVRGQLVEDRLKVEGTVRSALVSGDASGTLVTVQGRSGRPQITARSPVEFTASAEIARLAVFTGLFEKTTAYFDGRVRADLSGRGTLGEPALTGTIVGDRLALALPPEGIDLSGGTLRARLADKRIEVQQFSMRGGAGTLTAQGTLALAADPQATVQWRADRLTLLGRPDRRLIVTGSGTAAVDQGTLALDGALRADEGLFQYGESALPAPGPDVIIVGRPAPPPEGSTLKNTSLHLALDLGNDLHVVGHGLDAWIEGKAVLSNGPGGTLRAEGTVSTQRGTYTAFGQRLQIDRGRLTFNGPTDNPGLDIQAMRKNQAVEAGVAVSGTVAAPVVRIVSDPPVPEGEALSWLVLGHGPADASRADLAMLPLAAAALFGQGQAGEGSFAKKLGLDTVSLRGSGTLANNVLAVGKRFSHNLYVVYEQSIGGVANVLKIELNLTRRILVRAEAGQVSSAGLFFRYAFD